MKQVVGVPKEIKEKEFRVSCTPGNVRSLCRNGCRVLVESGAGLGCGFFDEDYRMAGAEVVPDADEVFAEATIILKVKEPPPAEFHRFRKRQVLFTFLHLAANAEVAKMLLEKEVSSFAYENVVVEGRLPLLQPMSEIAGRMSALVGAYYQSSAYGGGGILAGGVPGVSPADVLVLGGGISGANAARMATGLGAEVTVMDTSIEKLRSFDEAYGGRVKTLYSNEHNLLERISSVDILIAAVLLPGKRTPKLISRSMLDSMKSGSVIVDIAIDQGGCAETSRPTTHSDPVYEEEGVVHYCVANMPGSYGRTATLALTNATFPYVKQLVEFGPEAAIRQVAPMAEGLNTRAGEIVHPVVAEALRC